LGLLLRKNERTRPFIERQLEIVQRIAPDARIDEDEHLIAFTVPMNPNDFQSIIDQLEQQVAYGRDYVATTSADGVIGDVPPWLSETAVPVGPHKQLTKTYSFCDVGEA
jgi:hypothetical protein